MDDGVGLWVTIDGSEGRWQILGNSHSHAGRFLVRSVTDGTVMSASKDQVTEASDASRAWIDGFLSGSEPSLEAFLKVDWITADELDDDHPDVIRWHRATDFYREHGRLPVDDEG